MKKLLFILLIITTSCGYAPIDNSKMVVVNSIEYYDGIYCDYYGTGNLDMVSTPTDVNFKFRDTCGKFQIGDTIRFVK